MMFKGNIKVGQGISNNDFFNLLNYLKRKYEYFIGKIKTEGDDIYIQLEGDNENSNISFIKEPREIIFETNKSIDCFKEEYTDIRFHINDFDFQIGDKVFYGDLPVTIKHVDEEDYIIAIYEDGEEFKSYKQHFRRC